MTLSDLAERCCEYLASRGKSPNTVSSYRTCFRQFIAHITLTLKLSDDCKHFTDDAVESFATALFKSGSVTPNSIRTRLSALSTLAKVGAEIKDGRHRPVVSGNPLATTPQAQTSTGEVPHATGIDRLPRSSETDAHQHCA